MGAMAADIGHAGDALDPQDLLVHLERLLDPPLERWIDPAQRERPALRGAYSGHRTTIRLVPFIIDYTDDGTSSIEIGMEGKTYGLVCMVTPPN